MILTRTYELIIDNQEHIDRLDYVSNVLRTAYNNLLGDTIHDYKENNNKKDLLKNSYNLRNYLIQNKKGTDYEFIYSSLVKNTAMRLKDTYKRFFKGNGFPKFKAYNRKWFSLYYDEAGKSPKVNGNKVLIKLGKDKDGNNLNFECKIKGYLNEEFKTCRIIKRKDKNKYFIQFTVELPDKKPKEFIYGKDWVSIDPNHKNFFAAVDSDYCSLEVEKIDVAERLDKEIDKVKSKLSNKDKHSRRHRHLQNVLDRLYNKRDEQIKNCLYEIAHYLAKRYNVIIIGDYTPSKDVATYKNMRRSMLNQTHIGKFRHILKHVCDKYGKTLLIGDERYTTQKCCITDTLTKRPPDVRKWKVGNRKVLRDLNSSVNIASKIMAMSKDYVNNVNLSSIDVNLNKSFRKKLNICLAQTIQYNKLGVLRNGDNHHFYENTW